MNLNIFSDLRKPGLVPGENLSLSTKINYVLEKDLSYIMTNRMRSIHMKLKCYVLEGDNTYETVVVPRALTAQILRMAHDELGHNGTHRTYTILKRLYYLKGLKPSVEIHIKMCYQCQRRNKEVVKYATLHFDMATFPMQFISMDLIGEFYPANYRNHRYVLTIICMLTAYVFCVPLKTKTAEEVIQAYIDNAYSKFGGSLKRLSDNGTEFKNKMFEQIVKDL